MEGQNCANCRFVKQRGIPIQVRDTTYTHYCRCHPPQAFSGAEEHDAQPLTKPEGWCGEWQPANPETVEQGAAVMARLVLLGDLTAARALADKLTGND